MTIRALLGFWTKEVGETWGRFAFLTGRDLGSWAERMHLTQRAMAELDRAASKTIAGTTGASSRSLVTRAAYLSQPKTTRIADTRHAEPIGEIVKEIARNPGNREPEKDLPAALTGSYGPYTVEWRSPRDKDSGRVVIIGDILSDSEKRIGDSHLRFWRDADDYLVVNIKRLWLEEAARGQGFEKAFSDELRRYSRRSRVDVITVDAHERAWAELGFDWDPRRINRSFARIRTRIDDLLRDPDTTAADKQLLEKKCTIDLTSAARASSGRHLKS